ncbi:MAG: hypothetical protein MdMp014T_2515 [Treponematales bacterium]
MREKQSGRDTRALALPRSRGRFRERRRLAEGRGRKRQFRPSIPATLRVPQPLPSFKPSDAVRRERRLSVAARKAGAEAIEGRRQRQAARGAGNGAAIKRRS